MGRKKNKKIPVWLDWGLVILAAPFFISFCIGVVVGIITIIGQFIGSNFYRSDDIITIQFAEEYEKRKGVVVRYEFRIYAQSQDGVYERFVTNKWDIYNRLDIGAKYKVRTAGFRYCSFGRRIKEVYEQTERADDNTFVPIHDKMKYTPDFYDQIFILMSLVPVGIFMFVGVIFLLLKAVKRKMFKEKQKEK
jgi:hypothetical protein